MARGRKGLGVEPLKNVIRLKFTLSNGERATETLPWKPTAPNIRRAERLAAQIRLEIERGVFEYAHHFPDSKRIAQVASAKTAFTDWCDLYLESCGQLSANTKAQFRIQLNHWKKLIGADTRIADIRHSELKAKIGAFAWKSWRHHNNYLIPLRGVFALWVADAPQVRTNPVQGIKNLKPLKGANKVDRADALSRDEEDALLQHLSKNRAPLVFLYFDFAFATGMRPEEMIELKWADVDVNAKKPIARITRVRSMGEVRPPKNNEVRNVTLSARAVNALRLLRAYSYERPDGYVFINPETDKPWNSTASQRDHHWNPAMKALGLRHRTPYSTRHTRASRMLMAGCKPAWCAQQLGHAKEMFFRIYADWIEADEGDSEEEKVDGPFRPRIVHEEAA